MATVVVLVDEGAIRVHLAQLDPHARLLHRRRRRRRRRKLVTRERQIRGR